MTIKDGGPAFPQKEPLTNDWQGMTLRDHFAGLAMAAYLPTSGKASPDAVAAVSYNMADAMIRAREVTA